MSAQAKLAAALRKKPEDGEERPAAPAAPSETQQGIMKLKKSNLLGVVTWEEMLEKLELNGRNEYTVLSETVTKMLNNVINNPGEPKYRKVRPSNPTFNAKVYSCSGAAALFQLVGFKENVEEGFLVLPEAADLDLLRKAVDALAAQAVARGQAEEKKRKLEQEKAAKAREARAQKAREEAEPAAFDAAVASAQMVDEDEAMVEAIEAFMDGQPQLKAGRAIDSYAIERQVAGPGGSVVATVAASAGTNYFDYVAYMKRSDGGAWSVHKVEPA